MASGREQRRQSGSCFICAVKMQNKK
jgi:hypothetical protein